VAINVRGGLRFTQSEPDERKAIQQALLQNRTAISLVATGFIALIDDRLGVLANENPNSDDARIRRDQAIRHYENLKTQVDELLDATSAVSSEESSEPQARERAIESALSFSQGIEQWWQQRHLHACDGVFDLGIFAVAVGICVLAGADGSLTAIVAGALAGGNKVTEALKAYWGKGEAGA
jgi:hypothetical protein